jgi:xylulokinase
MLERAGIERRLLCDVQPSGTVLGEVSDKAARATGLAPGTTVVLGGHDHLCGALPVGAFREGVVLDVTGTWETVMTATDGPMLKDELRQAGMTVQAHVARGKYTVWGGNVAGEMLEWYRRELAARDGEPGTSTKADWQALMAEASNSPPGAHGVMFLPHMSGAACPMVDPQSLGAFAGLGVRTTRGDMLRAMIEGLDYQFLDILSAMQLALDSALDQIIAVGGATRNAFWMQNKADVVGRPVSVPAVEEATPLGAAILAGIAVGLYQDEEDAFERVYRPGTTYEPDATRSDLYAQWYPTYRELYPAVSSVSHRLFKEFTL